MRKINFLLIIILMLFVHQLSAQKRLGAKAAFGMYNMTLKTAGHDVSTQMIPSFNAGVFLDVPLTPEFAFRTELLLSQKGTKNKDLDNAKLRLTYLEVPVTFLYKGALSGGKVLVGFGPYVAYALAGKIKDGSNSTKVKFKTSVSATEAAQNTYLKPLDVGAKIYAGYELANGVTFTIESSLGLVNIAPKISGGDSGTAKNVGFGLSIGASVPLD